jgi:hypothetical protein
MVYDKYNEAHYKIIKEVIMNEINYPPSNTWSDSLFDKGVDIC